MIIPEDSDQQDADFMEALIPAEGRDEAIVSSFVTVIGWTDINGVKHWRTYCQSDAPATEVVGLLEFAKLDVIARSDTGLPLRHRES